MDEELNANWFTLYLALVVGGVVAAGALAYASSPTVAAALYIVGFAGVWTNDSLNAQLEVAIREVGELWIYIGMAALGIVAHALAWALWMWGLLSNTMFINAAIATVLMTAMTAPMFLRELTRGDHNA